jgi:adenylylsulfate kinase-like enzyme
MITIQIAGPRAAGKSVLAHHLAEYLRDRGHDVTLANSVDEAHSNFEVPRKILITERERVA